MTKIEICGKEYKIYFGYKATVQNGIIKKLVKMSEIADQMEAVEETLNVLPELLLVGLQKFHAKEFGFTYGDEADKDQKVDKVFNLLDSYFDTEDSDIMKLYNALQNELMENGFLSKLFREEQKAEAESAKRAEEKAKSQN